LDKIFQLKNPFHYQQIIIYFSIRRGPYDRHGQ
jgi:hypothetical protein